MSRSGLALLVAVGLLPALAGPAAADPGISRRLAALRVLVPREIPADLAPPPAAAPAPRAAPRPTRSVPRPSPPDQARGAKGCARDAWWARGEAAVRARIDRAIRDASLRFAVDESLIRSVIRHESAYDVNAVSHKGAMGLMQLMPATARELGVRCAFDPRQNVLGGTRYLRELRDRLGAWSRAIAAYNAGPARVESGRRLPRETVVYVDRVLGSWR